MKRPVDHRDLKIAGYCAPWSGAPGQRLFLHTSASAPARNARIVSLLDGAVAPGLGLDPPLPALTIATLNTGSHLDLELPLHPEMATWWLNIEFRLEADPAGRTLIGLGTADLGFDAQGRLGLSADDDRDAADPAGAIALAPGSWHRLRLSLARGNAFSVDDNVPQGSTSAAMTRTVPTADDAAPLAIRIGASRRRAVPSLNVRIGRICITDGDGGQSLHAWHPHPIGQPTRLEDEIGGGPAISVINAPTFCLPSPRWDGLATDPARVPDQFDALHLHEDDLDDAAWPAVGEIAIDGDAASGVYAVELTTAEATERIPFFVTPRRPSAAIAVLLPTFTYLAYMNEALPPALYPWACDDRGHRFAASNGLISLYDVHSDGSGVSLASARRPLATLRDDYRYPLCGCGHLLPVDLNLLRFCRDQNIAVDVLTDHDLDRDGAERLAGYRGLVTGSHPEYWTARMLDALDAFRTGGGSLAYLGGNGLYWVTAHQPPLLEVRRSTQGVRTWSDRPGESRLGLTGEPGGLWRDNGRPEHRTLGIGMAGMGFSAAQPYRRTDASFSGPAAWVFAGVNAETFGTSGTVLGAAAGYELDRRSRHWGTPVEAILLARADGFDTAYEADPTHVPEPGESAAPAADLTLLPGPGDSFVFSVGSVSWIGALPGGGDAKAGDADVGRITANVLRRMAGMA